VLAGYGKTITHVIIGLKTAKGTKQLKLDPSIYESLQKEKVEPGDVIYIEANSGAVKVIILIHFTQNSNNNGGCYGHDRSCLHSTDTTFVYIPQIHYRHDRHVHDGRVCYGHDRRAWMLRTRPYYRRNLLL